MQSLRSRLCGDRGSAIVEFALVAPLIVGVALVVLQLSLTLHVRSVLTAAAAEGARMASLVGSQLVTGERRTRQLLDGNLAGSVVTHVRVSRVMEDGLLMTSVRIEARLPLIGLLGPESLQITAHALQEHA